MFDGFSHDNIVKIKLPTTDNVNMNIADSISFYFSFGKGYLFVLRVKQKIFNKARSFSNEKSKSCDS